MERTGNRYGPVEMIEHTAYSDRFGGYASKISRVSLIIFLLFLFFGTSPPFQERSEKLEDAATENPVKQVVFSSLYLLSFIGLLPKISEAIDLIKKEKFLALFLLWSLLTVVWSDFPFLSFKRWIQASGTVLIFVSAILHIESQQQAWTYVRSILIAYIPLTLLSVFLFRGAIEPGDTAWRGFASHKNLLGQVSLLSLIIWARTAFHGGAGERMLCLIFTGVSCILLIGSKSASALLTGGILLILAGVLYAREKIVKPLVGGPLSLVLVFTFLTPLVIFAILEPNAVSSLFDLFGKDNTLTGRTEIWSGMVEEIKNHWIIGCGFKGYWSTQKPSLVILLQDLQWYINQGHNGYLDILNETGIIGFSIFLLLTIVFFKNLATSPGPYYWSWVVIAVLIMNFTESTMFSDNVSGCLFVFSYLLYYANRTKGASGMG